MTGRAVEMGSKPRILYGEADFRAFSRDNGYYVDKTQYIPMLENFRSPVFLRPRRFGKSLMCTTLQHYYDVNSKDMFDTWFANTYIGANPTPEKNSYFVLHFDFSIVDSDGDAAYIKDQFFSHLNIALEAFLIVNHDWFKRPMEIDSEGDAIKQFNKLLTLAGSLGLPPFYIIIDEYDNFANQLILERRDQLYREITGKNGFLKAFFKLLKQHRKTGAISRIFITGVLPITIDELASGYNIASFITMDKDFEAMAGFSQSEVHHLLDRIYDDYDLDPAHRYQVEAVIKDHYNGYHIADPKAEALYNSTILMYFLEKLTRFGEITQYLTDLNLKTDIAWIRRLTSSNPEHTHELVDQLLAENRLNYNSVQLTEKFDMSQFFEKSFYPISFFYLGMLTRRSNYEMCLPNQNMQTIFADYFNTLYKINVGTLYTQMMTSFVDNPDLPKLFADFWDIYVSQLPEAVFARVNENFYRTTFYSLCQQFLSQFYVWRMENSHASGRSDLEMEGKYHTRFSADRYLMEFKYFSNAKSKDLDLDSFCPPEQDWNQLAGYHQEQCTSYPEMNISSYLIYCFGNIGFRVFPLVERTHC